ncbi:MAG TPA: hypothetical protein VL172_09915 [Kofleriaceae bacterium]|nr:hypothetical protein [Kofleriaceae bacterium]
MKPTERAIDWRLSGDALLPWVADVDGQRWQVRINDYTRGEPLYSLLVDGVTREDFGQWPACWTRPELPPDPDYVPPRPINEDDPAQQAEYEHEGDRYRNLKG